jgi:hypothetical protein
LFVAGLYLLIVVPRSLPAAALIVRGKALFVDHFAQAFARGGAHRASQELNR